MLYHVFHEGSCIMRKPMECFTFLFLCYFLWFMLGTSTALEIMNPGETLRDGETLVSAGRSFELGFFSPRNSKSRFLGIWYKMISTETQTVVWVANRETPLSDREGSLNFTAQGILVLYNSTNYIIWSSSVSRPARDPIAQLIESGNVVVKERNDSNPVNLLWQSFDYPCDTLLPGMKLGVNFETGHESFLSSWKTAEDPSVGEFSLLIDTRGYPQMVLRKGPAITSIVGSWNEIPATGIPGLKQDSTFVAEFVFNEKEVYFRFDIQISSVFSRYFLNPLGIAERFTWMDQMHDWVHVSSSQVDKCENYAFCGAYSTCRGNYWPGCSCLYGFTPKMPNGTLNWTDGCTRRKSLACSKKDWFLKREGIKLPDTSSSRFIKSLSQDQCKQLCSKNCSCTAYAHLHIRKGGRGCLLWFGDLIGITESADYEHKLYIRMAASEPALSFESNRAAAIAFTSIMLAIGIIILGMISYIRMTNYTKPGISIFGRRKDYDDKSRMEDMELPIFDLATIVEATRNFSISNKLGQGGFGSVYKGILEEGREIAVKRLSKNSRQGLNEFKNEVILIAKLQHRNLVKLLGCCIHEDEKMLIYEYMPNKSLDSLIFDQTRSKGLDWRKRMHIIDGIARGILYLHQDSRLRIIHRDLKTSNVLLDKDMNPKISDFGLARTFGVDQTEANTNRVVGTYGYMSPEYAVDGLFSMKSDVFSFGVLVLEIISGKRNRGFCHQDHDLNLLGHAWTLWNEGRPSELIENYLGDSCSVSQVLRCINVALLCVQRRPEDRPTMSSVVVMLSSDGPLPQPKQTGFFMQRNAPETNTSLNKKEPCSINNVTVTMVQPR